MVERSRRTQTGQEVKIEVVQTQDKDTKSAKGRNEGRKEGEKQRRRDKKIRKKEGKERLSKTRKEESKREVK